MAARAQARGRTAAGSVYLLVLAASLLVTVVGVGAALAVAAVARTAEDQAACVQARYIAQGAVDLGLLALAIDPSWRTDLNHGYWAANRAAGGGTFSLQGLDESDGNLTDSVFDGITLIGTGDFGRARQHVQVRAVPAIQPLDALRCALHAQGNIQVNGGEVLTLLNGPLSTNGQLRNYGSVVGNVEAAGIVGAAGVTGSISVPAPPKAAPSAEIFSYYRGLATPLGTSGTIDKRVLGPGYNAWGATHPEGLYYMDATGKDITIKNSRIHGTLVIQCPGRCVTIEGQVLLEPARADYPALIINGNVVMRHESLNTSLSEPSAGVNFNPASVPYRGSGDWDTSDVYPNQINGVVHVLGDLEIADAARVAGAVICEGSVLISDSPTLANNPAVASPNPPQYVQPGPMMVVQDSWQQKVE